MGAKGWGLRLAALACAILAGGCTYSDALIQYPVSSVWSRPPADIGVFFATDRDLTDTAQDADGDGHWGAALRCGRKDVTIPALYDKHTIDVESAPCDSAATLADFTARLAAEAAAKGCPGVLLEVHGYNNTFRSALLHAGQVAMDTQSRCPVLLFSWSSEGLFNRYAVDSERSGYAVPELTRLIQAIAGRGLGLNILAHSMGARITLSALGATCRDGVRPGELILAAPDVGAELGNDDFGHLLGRTADCVRRITVYASLNDMALIASQGLHGYAPRAGRAPREDMRYARPGAVEIVNASLAPGDPSGHAYYETSYEMARDMMWVLNGTALADRAAPGLPGGPTLECAEAEGCTALPYQLIVAPERRPGWTTRLLRHLWGFIVPLG